LVHERQQPLSPLVLPLTRRWFEPLADPFFWWVQRIFSFKNLSDSVTGVDDTLDGFFGLFFAFSRF